MLQFYCWRCHGRSDITRFFPSVLLQIKAFVSVLSPANRRRRHLRWIALKNDASLTWAATRYRLIGLPTQSYGLIEDINAALMERLDG